MDIGRIHREFAEARRTFALVELYPTPDGNVFARTALQTVSGHSYVLSIRFPDSYPNQLPAIFIDAPAISYAPHRWPNGAICYMHPTLWNPGVHHLTFVIARAAKWLNKYEVWRGNGGTWPGAEMRH
jgi:ubiquitin-protein ligase